MLKTEPPVPVNVTLYEMVLADVIKLGGGGIRLGPNPIQLASFSDGGIWIQK